MDFARFEGEIVCVDISLMISMWFITWIVHMGLNCFVFAVFSDFDGIAGFECFADLNHFDDFHCFVRFHGVAGLQRFCGCKGFSIFMVLVLFPINFVVFMLFILFRQLRWF